MKKWMWSLLLLLALQQPVLAGDMLDMEFPEDRAVLVVEEGSGQVLYAQNEEKTMYPASLTKLMTALVVLDNNSLEDLMIPGEEMDQISPQSSRAYLIKNQEISIQDALAGLLLPSGNDAAMALAVHTARTVEKDPRLPVDQALQVFGDLMNQKAEELGMTSSHFINPHGLHDPAHVTSAKDLLILTKEIRSDDFIAGLLDMPVYETDDGRYEFYSTNLYHHQKLDDVWFLYQKGPNPQYREEVTGVKTGNTNEAGRCLIFSAEEGSTSVIGILLHSDIPLVYEEGMEIMDGIFDGMEWVEDPGSDDWDRILELEGLLFFPGEELELTSLGSMSHLVRKDSTKDVFFRVVLETDKLRPTQEGTHRLLKTLEDGEIVGNLEMVLKDRVLKSVPVAVVHGRAPVEDWLPLGAVGSVVLVLLFGIRKKMMVKK